MTTKFDRPMDFGYNADLQTLNVAINQLIDAVQELQDRAKASEAPKAPAVPKPKAKGRKTA